VAKKLGTVALFVGAFVLALAVLSKFYMYDRLAVVPQNNVSTNTAESAGGNDAEYLNAAEGLVITNGPLKNTKLVTGDVKASKAASKELDRDVAVWNIYDCTAAPSFDCGSGETALSATQDTVAFDRHTGQTVKWSGNEIQTEGKTTKPASFEGLYFKFPFDAQKKTYQFWDGTLNKATPAKYVGEGTVKGMKVYKYRQTIDPVVTGPIDVPGSLVGSAEPTVTADQVYSSVTDYSVDPVTGVVLVGQTAQDNYLEIDGERKLTTTKATLKYTDKTTTDSVDEYKSKAMLLTAVKTWIPIGGGILGVVLLGVGAFLLLGKRSKGSRRADADSDDLVGAER
jgi:hypothetical protein